MKRDAMAPQTLRGDDSVQLQPTNMPQVNSLSGELGLFCAKEVNYCGVRLSPKVV